MNKMIGCGCSFTYGYVKVRVDNSTRFITAIVEDYVTKVSNRLGIESINLSRPGASNYAIVKQIEYAITLDPSLVIIGATTPLRVDFSFPETKLNKRPTINDFDYGIYESKKFIGSFSKGNIVSKPIMYLLDHVAQDRRLLDIFKYHATYTDEFIKKDQDRLMLLGAFSLLNRKNIPYICVDFAKLISQDDAVNSISYGWRELNDQFPSNHDPLHFSEDGHEFLANEILKQLKGKLT